ncbi:MAG: pilin [Zoogloeaceae bacterium]|nr:pilin [Zoogloeaceae bacterium]
MARAQTTRVYGELSYLRDTFEVCVLHGLATLGTGDDECHPYYTASNLVFGNSQISSIPTPPGHGFPKVTFVNDGSGITHTLEATFGNKASSHLRGKGLLLQRQSSGTWECVTQGGLEPKWAPIECRNGSP